MRVTVTDDSPASDGKFLCDSVAQCVPSAEMLTIGGVSGGDNRPGDCHYTTDTCWAGADSRGGGTSTLRSDTPRRLDTLHLNCVML